MAAGPHVNARRVQVQLGQPFRFCPALASAAHHSLHACKVDVSPEGVTNIEQSMERDRSAWGVTNDAVVRLPDHAPERAVCTNVYSVFVRTTRLAMSIRTLTRPHQLVASARAGYGHNSAPYQPIIPRLTGGCVLPIARDSTHGGTGSDTSRLATTPPAFRVLRYECQVDPIFTPDHKTGATLQSQNSKDRIEVRTPIPDCPVEGRPSARTSSRKLCSPGRTGGAHSVTNGLKMSQKLQVRIEPPR